ncbi:hypothetical protein ABZS29_30665 [Kribbella sp. NPDC005582]|uniref:maleate cis-trans isomerase family protein n=1 Tax=Kribbella sp. NPDC005582 TaxID=3156893 RepID=UPI0033B1A366
MLKVGVLTPHAAPGPEVELPEMASAGLEVELARVSRRGGPPSAADELRQLATPAALRPAVSSLRASAVDVVAYASTTSGYAIGQPAEAGLVEDLRRAAGVPVVSSGLAAVQALTAFGIRRVALIHPPWFEAAVSALGARYFGEQGIEAITFDATPLPKDPGLVRSQQVVDYVSDQVDSSTEAVFIAGNGFRAAAAIEELERRTGQLVLEANQLLLWASLAATGAKLQVGGYGRLFALKGADRPPSAAH